MRIKSVFCAECVCGRCFETEEREYTCPVCKRVIVLQWGIGDGTAAEEHPSTESAEVAA